MRSSRTEFLDQARHLAARHAHSRAKRISAIRAATARERPRPRLRSIPGCHGQAPLIRVVLLLILVPAALAQETKPAASDDWPMFRGDPQLTGVAHARLPDKPTIRWRAVLKEPIEASAAIVGDLAYVGSHDAQMRAYDLTSGAQRWSYTAREAILSSPTVIAGVIYFGDEAGVMHAVDAASGEGRWTFQTEASIISSANPYRERIVFGSYDGYLYCLTAADGKLVWKYETEDRVHATPAIAGDQTMVAGCDGQLHVVDLKDGKPVRKTPLDSACGASPAVFKSHAYLGTYGEEVLGIDFEAGTVEWRFVDEDRRFPFLASAAVDEQRIYIGGRDKRIRALRSADGQQVWEFATGGRVEASPVLIGDRVLCASSDGILYLLDAQSGKEVWRFDAAEPIVATPAVAHGAIVFGTLDGTIYCLGSK